MEPQSTMVISVLDELELMNLPPCWMGDHGVGWELGRGLERSEKLLAPIDYGDCSKHL